MNPEELQLDEASEYTITKPPYNEKEEREKCRRQLAFIYDIPKEPELFSNQSLAAFIIEFDQDFAGVEVQIVKESNWAGEKSDTAPSKPFWSARVMFKSCEQRDRAIQKLKYFTLNGWELRMLGFDDQLCNIWVDQLGTALGPEPGRGE